MAHLDILLTDDQQLEDQFTNEKKTEEEDSHDIVIEELIGDVCQAVATDIVAPVTQENQNDSKKKVITSEPMDEKDYVVERILDKQIDSKGRSRYFVKWAKYPSSANTWEPLENLVDCDHALQKYELRRAEALANRLVRNQELEKSSKDKLKTSQNLKKVDDILGLTVINEEKHFLISLQDEKSSKCFIRASLANHLFPGKVIDFYVKNICWKHKSD